MEIIDITAVTGWVRDIFLIILTIAFIEILLPSGSLAKYLRFIFSVIILAAILSPVMYLRS